MRARSRLYAIIGSLAVLGGTIGGMVVSAVATAAPAASNVVYMHANKPAHAVLASKTIIPVPRACSWNLNGPNVLALTFQGSTFTYPVFLHEQNNGLISGVLFD